MTTIDRLQAGLAGEGDDVAGDHVHVPAAVLRGGGHHVSVPAAPHPAPAPHQGRVRTQARPRPSHLRPRRRHPPGQLPILSSD